MAHFTVLGRFGAFPAEMGKLAVVGTTYANPWADRLYREKGMETRTGKQRKARRFKVIPGGKNVALLAARARLAILDEAASADISYDRTSERSEAGLPVIQASTDIVCCYGVAVRYTSIEGLELVEFEFLPDAA